MLTSAEQLSSKFIPFCTGLVGNGIVVFTGGSVCVIMYYITLCINWYKLCMRLRVYVCV